jgi:hypothetical protein
MTMFAPVILAPLLLEHDHFGAARLLNDFRPNRGIRDERLPYGIGSVVIDRKHFIEAYLASDFALNPLDDDLIAGPDSVLFSPGFDYREHRI